MQVIQAPAWPLPTSNAVSALPLSALVSTTSASSASPSQSQQRLGALIELTRTTLVVPVLDFLALVTLATESNASGVASVRACMDASVLSQAALLAPGIQVRKRGTGGVGPGGKRQSKLLRRRGPHLVRATHALAWGLPSVPGC